MLEFKLMKALISVSDKSNLKPLLTELSAFGYEFISTGGSASFIKEAGFNVQEVSELTEFPEMMNGRVKTLHPKVHAGILARRDNEEHISEAKSHDIEMIDLVIVNLYPFFETVKECAGAQLNGSLARSHSEKAKYQKIIENIDVGGPTMLRSAAKNHESVTAISSIEQYDSLINELKSNNGKTSFMFRKKMAAEVFSNLAHYDSLVANYLLAVEEKTDSNDRKYLNLALEHKQTLRYGENPHQKASLIINPYEGDAGVANAQQLQGKELSFNNLIDLDAAWNIVSEYDDTIPCVSIIKHTNPCGVAIAPGLAQAFTEALACDTVSAFGGIVAANKTIDVAAANEMTQLFLEAVIAPDYSAEALEIFSTKKNLRVLKIKPSQNKSAIDLKKISGGYLVQDRNDFLFDKENIKIVTKEQIDESTWVDLIFAWKVCKHVKSNAIVVAQSGKTIGIGCGQTSRVKAVQDATMNIDLDTRGAVLASDAFFPFPDSIHLAAQHHIKTIIQPGGSIKDDEVIKACDELGIAMAFTGTRHFKH